MVLLAGGRVAKFLYGGVKVDSTKNNRPPDFGKCDYVTPLPVAEATNRHANVISRRPRAKVRLRLSGQLRRATVGIY